MCPEKEQIILTNDHLYFRKNGLPCPNCGDRGEYLWVVGNAVFLVCDKCEQHKSKDPFLPT